MRERLHVRIAERAIWRGSSKFKVEASQIHNPRPIEIAGRPAKTVHFAIDLEIPDSILKDPAMPVVKLTIDPGQGYAIEPTVEQVAVEPPDTTRSNPGEQES